MVSKQLVREFWQRTRKKNIKEGTTSANFVIILQPETDGALKTIFKQSTETKDRLNATNATTKQKP